MPAKRNWDEIVTKSDGNMIFIPDEFASDMEKWEKGYTDFNAQALAMAEKEIAQTVLLNNIMFQLRKHLAKNGQKEIWKKDIRINLDALNEGRYIVEVTK